MKNQFRKSLAIGKPAEVQIREMFKALDFEVKDITDKHKKHDLVASYPNMNFKIEVKNDVESLRTGNLFFEFTALEPTEANLVIFLSGSKIFVFTKKEVTDILNSEYYKTVNVNQDKVGSNVPYSGKLVPIKSIEYYEHSFSTLERRLAWIQSLILAL